MGLSYPIAANARAALLLQDEEVFAANITDAKAKAKGPVALVTEWLKPTPDETDILVKAADGHIARGFVQTYADDQDEPVFAVSFWKHQSAEDLKKTEEDEARLRAQHAREHTNDIYFTRPELRRKRFPGRSQRMRDVHPDQIDLFSEEQE
ncbi:MAG: hypothetical protein CME88_03825 [Hirschia sp.]|nr:hypothetical protein [Hirschia sp.]MBF17486.1 hypothetical protein [Hirschia sp.]